MNEGIKYDGEKPDMSLLSPVWVEEVAKVLTFGKQKYTAHNWRNGLAVSRLLAAALRHTFAFLSGADKDPETGLSHLAHASCCLMFAYETVLLRRNFDDRWRPTTDNTGDTRAAKHAGDVLQSQSGKSFLPTDATTTYLGRVDTTVRNIQSATTDNTGRS